MSRNRKLTDLKNIGKKIDSRLNEVAIFSEGALTDKHCNVIEI